MYPLSLHTYRKSIALGFAMLLVICGLFIQNTQAHASTDTEVTDVLPSLFSTTQMVLTAVSEEISKDGALASTRTTAGGNSNNAQIAVLMALLQQLIQMYNSLLAEQSMQSDNNSQGKMFIKVTSPTPGTSWTVGTTQTVKWTSNNLGSSKVFISLGDQNNKRYIYRVTGVSNTGNYTWSVPFGIPSGTYSLVICTAVYEGETICSDYTYVNIVNERGDVVRITSPVSTATYTAGDTINVVATYVNAVGANSLPVYLDRVFGDLAWTKLGTLDSNGFLTESLPRDLIAGEYDLYVCLEEDMLCGTPVRIKIKSSVASVVEERPTITLISPNGGEELFVQGKDVDFRVKWTSSNLSGTASIYLNFVDGRMCLLGTAPVQAGEYAVTIPGDFRCSNGIATITSGQYLIKIATDTENPNGDMKGINDGSDNYFTLTIKRDSFSVDDTSKTRTPSIIVTNPTSRMKLVADGGKDSGTITHIKWEQQNGDYPVNIYLVNRNKTRIKTIAEMVPNTGSYAWGYDSSIRNGTYAVEIELTAIKGDMQYHAYSGFFSFSDPDVSR